MVAGHPPRLELNSGAHTCGCSLQSHLHADNFVRRPVPCKASDPPGRTHTPAHRRCPMIRHRLALALLILAPLAAPPARAASIVAGTTFLPGRAIQDITLLAGTPFN